MIIDTWSYQRFSRGRTSYTLDLTSGSVPGLSCTRSQAALARDKSDVYTSFLANTARATNRGVLCEPRLINYAFRTDFSGFVPGTPGTVPADQFFASAPPITRTINSITPGIIPLLSVTQSRTNTDTQSLFLYPRTAAELPAVAGDQLYFGFWFQVTASSNISAVSLRPITTLNNGVFGNRVLSFDSSGLFAYQRASVATPPLVTGDTTGRVRLFNVVHPTVGAPYSLTYTIGGVNALITPFPASVSNWYEPIANTATTSGGQLQDADNVFLTIPDGNKDDVITIEIDEQGSFEILRYHLASNTRLNLTAGAYANLGTVPSYGLPPGYRTSVKINSAGNVSGYKRANAGVTVANNLFVAYSTRRMRPSYVGPCMRVRRSSDNLEADINFNSSGELDQTALLAHVGVGDGRVVTWYDQSVNSFHLTQSNVTFQPFIVTSGVVELLGTKPAPRFSDGVSAPYFLSRLVDSDVITGKINGAAAVVASFISPSSKVEERYLMFLKTLTRTFIIRRINTTDLQSVFEDASGVNQLSSQSASFSTTGTYAASFLLFPGQNFLNNNSLATRAVPVANFTASNTMTEIRISEGNYVTCIEGRLAEACMFFAIDTPRGWNEFLSQQRAFYGV